MNDTRLLVLKDEEKKVHEKIVQAEIDILVLEKMAPDTVIARKPANKDPKTGQALSWIGVSAKDLLEQNRKDLENYKTRLGVIEYLMSKN